MVRSTIFSIALLLSTFFHAIKGVTVEGSLWLLDENKGKKEIALFFDVHNQERFKLREMEELKELLDILKLYSKTAQKPLHILVEHSFDAPGVETILGSLFKILMENPLPNIIVENIEQRGASASFVDLIKWFLKNSGRELSYRESATNKYYEDSVSLQDVVNEYNLINIFLEEAYNNASQKVKEIHDREMAIIKSIYGKFETEVEKYKERGLEGVRFEKLIKPCPHRYYIEYLGDLVHHTFSLLMDLYLFHRALALPTDHKVMVLAGGAHSGYVKSGIMGFLGAKSDCRYGSSIRSVGEEHAPLTKEQFAHIILGKQIKNNDLR